MEVLDKEFKKTREMEFSLHQRKTGQWGSLAAGSSKGYVRADKPKFDGKIDITDKTLVESKLKEFEESVLKEPIEHAYVIIKDGKTYHFKGSADRVNPEILGEALKEAIVSHNHPIRETHFSFSEDDFELFQKYHLTELRGFDEEYEYILKRNGISPEIEILGLLDMDEREYWHQFIYKRAIEEGVYYERIKKTTGGGRK